VRVAGAAVSTSLVLTLALESAVPPFATDMYTPAFPRVTADLASSASLVGLTLTTFFLGMALGQLLGGPLSDQRGRRMPIIAGGLICTLGAVGCALAPSIGFLVVSRVVQGFGGGLAAVVARAVVDVAKGDRLAKVMSIMMALGGLAPMIAPVLGGLVLTLGGSWRTVFWVLVGFGLLMMSTAVLFVPESLPRERRRGGGLRRFTSGLGEVLRIRVRRLHVHRGVVRVHDDGLHRELLLRAAGAQRRRAHALRAVLRLHRPGAGSAVSRQREDRRTVPTTRTDRVRLILASVAVAALTVGVLAFDTPLLLTCAGFLVLMAVQAFIFGNASALAAGEARHVAGAAFAVIGVVLAVAMATSARLASSGGSTTAVPMIWVMIVGVAGSLFAYLVVARPSIDLNALSCVFPADPELLPSAADARAREHGITKAKSSLATELHRLREIGATADGAVSDADPITAIRKALAQRRFDEIILSTLPPGVSRWLARDLPRRVRRRTGVPLTVITAPSGEAERA
jgi:MFS transporter, DHA1 family, multidrug resistance protein